jgi:hypothetical protein
LPDAVFAARLANGAQPFLFRQRFGEAGLDQAAARREVGVTRRQRPNCV